VVINSSDLDSNNNLFNRDLGIIKVVLEAGHSVVLPSTGFSMFPALRPGDLVVVKPLMKGEIPENGSVVVYEGVQDKRLPIAIGKSQDEEQQIAGSGVDKREEISSGQRGLVMHRLLEIFISDSGESMFITRGDSMTAPDISWPGQNLLGVAESYKRGNKEYQVKSFIPSDCMYKINRCLLWLNNKILRVYKLFKV
jgi:signal peptidase I